MLHEIAAAGEAAARNVHAAIRGREPSAFSFKTNAQRAAIGWRTGAARIFGLQFSGFVAWWLWRTIYLSKLPRLEKKVRVVLDWTFDLFFTKDLVRQRTPRPPRFARREPFLRRRSSPAAPAPDKLGLPKTGRISPPARRRDGFPEGSRNTRPN